MNNAKIGLAVVGGYFLGRTKKAKMALGLGLFLAGRKLRLEPHGLGRMIADSPVLGGLSDQARDQLVDATKSAASAALTKRINGLADSLHERTLRLDGSSGAADDERADEEREGADGDGGNSRSGGDSSNRRGAAKSTRSKSGSPSTASARTAGKSKGKAAASGPRRTTTAARRTTTGSRKAASRGTRTTSQRGGDDD